jgi:hypothetical protein
MVMVLAAITQSLVPPLIGVAHVSWVPVTVPFTVSNVVGVETARFPVGAVAKQTVYGALP